MTTAAPPGLNRRIATVAAAAAVMAGVVAVVIPQHAMSVARVAATTVAVVTGALVLRAVAAVASIDPPTSSLDHLATSGVAPLDPHGLRDARRDLGRPTTRGTVPPAIQVRLADARARAGVSLDLPPSSAAGDRTRRGDAAAVATHVHRTLDQLDASRTGVNRHGNH